MKYPVAIWEENGVFTAEAPSLPGVVTEADSFPELERAVKEAASAWIEAELDAGRPIPEPGSVNDFRNNPAYKDSFWMVVDIDIESLTDKIERVNITMPAKILRRLDFLAANSGTSRSGYLSQLVLHQSTNQNLC